MQNLSFPLSDESGASLFLCYCSIAPCCESLDCVLNLISMVAHWCLPARLSSLSLPTSIHTTLLGLSCVISFITPSSIPLSPPPSVGGREEIFPFSRKLTDNPNLEPLTFSRILSSRDSYSSLYGAG
jgi:hypothetical protein